MNKLYPLKFTPIIKEKLWGGTKLSRILGKVSNSHLDGESWELSAVPNNHSILANGHLAGASLPELIAEFKQELVGDFVFDTYGTSFPLLFKFIDAQEDLSIQVHPNDELALERHNSLGKTEMWYIVDADDDASLIVGFNKSITAQEYQRHVDNDTLLEVLNRESVKKDDVLYIPAGRIHTIGKGLLIAEIQQSSDVTYRIHDFNRVDSDGKTRELHNDLALDAIDFSLPESYLTSYDVHASECIIGHSDYFITKRIRLNEPTTLRFTSESCTVLMCVDGDLNVNGIPELRNITRGETILVPASQKELSMVPTMNSTLLEVTIPNLSE